MTISSSNKKKTTNLAQKIDFVLVRPQYAGNAGAAARALKNTGFKKMVLVNPAFQKDDLDVVRFAVGARPLVEKAPVFENIEDALKPYKLILGTSRRKGAYRKNLLELKDLVPFLSKTPVKGKIAILFGHEASGLSNEEFKHCQHLIYIPANPRFESFNLGQAVLLIAYELFRATWKAPPPEKEIYPTHEQLEGLYQHLTEAFLEIGFVKNENPHHMPRIFRNIFNRARLTEPEVRVLRGVCRQILWYKNTHK